MKFIAICLMLAPTVYAQSTANHQGHATEGDSVVTGTGFVQMPSANTSTERYKRTAMGYSENDAMDQCACGTLAHYDCIERVSNWRVSAQPDRPMFPTKWFTVATAEFKCI